MSVPPSQGYLLLILCTDVLLFPWLLAGFLTLWLTVGGIFLAMLVRLIAQGPVLDSCCLA